MKPENKNVIEITDMTIKYRERIAVQKATLKFPQSKLIAVVGPNGGGKTTLLKGILGLVPINSGSITILGKNKSSIGKLYDKIAYVPQRGSVDWDFPTSVLDVVIMGRYGHLGYFKRPGQKEKTLALDALKMVGMSEYRDNQIGQLSGGQQQRVFIARALVQQAEIYILDEPFAGVDATTEESIISVLQNLRNLNKTIIVVHHDLNTLSSYFDWLVLINQKIYGYGPLKEVFTKETLKNTYGGRIPLFLQENFLANTLENG